MTTKLSSLGGGGGGSSAVVGEIKYSVASPGAGWLPFDSDFDSTTYPALGALFPPGTTNVSAASTSYSGPSGERGWDIASDGSGTIVCVNDATSGNDIFYSTNNGTSWNALNFTGTNSGANAYSVAYGNGLWMIAGDAQTGIWTSPDAINWTQRTRPYTGAVEYALMYGNGFFWVYWIFGDTFYKSVDGVSWSSVTSNLTSLGVGTLYKGAVNSLGTMIMVENGNGGVIRRSTNDGETFATYNVGSTSVDVTREAFYNEDTGRWFVAAEDTTDIERLYYSDDDGITWLSCGITGLSDGCYGVAASQNVVVAIGLDGDAVYSTTGGVGAWTPLQLPDSPTFTLGITLSQDSFFICGNNSSGALIIEVPLVTDTSVSPTNTLTTLATEAAWIYAGP